ncbi:MAG: ABC transporter ATP-binding protein, partial [Pseudomonadota bacterium]
MHQDAIAPPGFLDRSAARFVSLMRLDAPPVIEPLPADYQTRRALPFLYDVVRSAVFGRALLVIVAAIISQVMFSLQPYALSQLIDDLAAELQGESGRATLWVFVLFGFWIGGPLFFHMAQLINVYLLPALRVAIKARLFQHLMGHAPHFFQVNLPGRLAQKVTQAANSSQGVVTTLTIDGVQTVILMVTSSLLLGSLSAIYGWVLAVWIVVFLGLTAWLGSFGIELFRKVQNAISKVSGRLVDTINNWELVRSFGRLDRERDVLEGVLAEEAARSRRSRLFF